MRFKVFGDPARASINKNYGNERRPLSYFLERMANRGDQCYDDQCYDYQCYEVAYLSGNPEVFLRIS